MSEDWGQYQADRLDEIVDKMKAARVTATRRNYAKLVELFMVLRKENKDLRTTIDDLLFAGPHGISTCGACQDRRIEIGRSVLHADMGKVFDDD